MYPDNPPAPPEQFSHRDPASLAAMYTWAGSSAKLATYLNSVGYEITASALNQWRVRLGIPVQNPHYRGRGADPLAPAPPQPEPDRTLDADELLWYLQNRTVLEPPPPAVSASGRKYATALVAADLHFPYQHRGAFEVFLGLIADTQPEEVVLAGDIFDWPQLGRYIKKPSEVRALQDELDVCRGEVLARVNTAAPRATKRFLVGNHEHGRWQRYLWDKAPALASLRCLDMEALLGLSEMGWVFQNYEWWPTDALCVTHGWRHTNQIGGGSAASARKQFLDMGCSGVSFHTHHLGSYFRQDRSGYYCWVEGGCLCDWRKMQEAGVTTRTTPTRPEDWHLGCVRIHYHPGGSAFRLELIPILEDEDGRTFCIADGHQIEWHESRETAEIV